MNAIKNLEDNLGELREKFHSLSERNDRKGLNRIEISEAVDIGREIELLERKLKNERQRESQLIGHPLFLGNAAKAEFSEQLKDAVLSLKNQAVGSSKEFKVQDFKGLLNAPRRSVLTSDGSDVSGTAQLYQGTSNVIAMQAGSRTDIFSQMTIHSDVKNDTRIPYFDRDNFITAQQQTDQTTSLSEQAPIVSSFVTAFKDFQTQILVHDNVLHDAQNPAALKDSLWLMGMNQIKVEVLRQILTGTGTGNELTGLQNLSGVQLINTAGAAPTNFDEVMEALALIDLKNGDPTEASILTNPHGKHQILTLKDLQNRYLYGPRAYDEIWTNRFYTSTAVDTSGEGVGAYELYVGNWRHVHLFGDQTYRIELGERYRDKLQQAYIIHHRVDMKMVDPEMMVYLKGYRKGTIT